MPRKAKKAGTMVLILAVLFQFVPFGVASAEVVNLPQSAKTFGGNSWDYCCGLAATRDGGFVMVGHSLSEDGDMQGLNNGSDTAIIIKYDSDGKIEWKRSFGGSAEDEFCSVAATRDGGCIVVGDSCSKDGDMSGMNKGCYDGIIVKYNAAGQLEWKRSFGGSSYEYFYGVTETADGGYLAVGKGNSNDGDMQGLSKGKGGFDAVIVKYKPNGDIEWKESLGNKNNDCYNGVVTTSDGGAVAVGYSTTDNLLAQGIIDDVRATVVKYNTNGQVEWVRYFGSIEGADAFNAVTSTADGGIVAVGNSYSRDGDMQGLFKGWFDAVIVKYRPNGEMEWKQSFGGFQGDSFNAVTATSDGGVVATGKSWSPDQDMQGTGLTFNAAITIKYRGDGTVEWKKFFLWPNDLDIYAATQLTDGSILIGGHLIPIDENNNIGEGVQDAVLIKYGREFNGWPERPEPKPTLKFDPTPVPNGSYVGTPDLSWASESLRFTLDSSGKKLITDSSKKETSATEAESVEAKPTSSAVMVNGKQISFEAYNIQGYNYFKLRDVAMALAGTNKRFEVNYDSRTNSVTIVSNRNYTAVGGELKTGNAQGPKLAKATESKVYVNGQEVKFVAYNVDGYNYFKLRDLAKVLNFAVIWDGENNAIRIDTSQPYSG
ncbi:MAG TPA: hypothetical protein GXX40_02700 [Firmicutes bacterium]|nr:hypothetical protein [Bacillota bacterium]